MGIICVSEELRGDQPYSAGMKGGPHEICRISDGRITVNNVKKSQGKEYLIRLDKGMLFYALPALLFGYSGTI